MTTLEQIRADIKNQLFVGRILNSKDFDDGLKWCLELIDKYAEQDKLMIIEANVNGYTQGLKDTQRQSCENCKQDPKECGNDDHYGFCQNWEYAEQEPCRVKNELKVELNELEPCDDAVSRQAALDVIVREQFKGDAISGIEKLPPVRPQEQKTGHWIDADGDNAICSCCNRLNHFYGEYCKHCGAMMVEPQERSEQG